MTPVFLPVYLQIGIKIVVLLYARVFCEDLAKKYKKRRQEAFQKNLKYD